MFGTRHQAEELYGEIETVLATVGLRSATDKTRRVGIDEGLATTVEWTRANLPLIRATIAKHDPYMRAA